MDSKLKTITSFDYEIIKICKTENNAIEKIGMLINKNDFSYKQLILKDIYSYLLKVIFNLSDSDMIKKILTICIPKTLSSLNENIGYKELCEMLIKEIKNIEIKKYGVGLFLIHYANIVMSIEKYEEMKEKDSLKLVRS